MFVFVVAPSGAGKDSVLNAAKARLGDNDRFIFVRRAITRAADTNEDHEPLSEQEFAARLGENLFAMHWQAHGLHYGIARAYAEAEQAGKVVVANGSRAELPQARAAFRQVHVVGIDAAPEIIHQRLLARGRENAADIEARMRRLVPLAADTIIDNNGALDDAVERFVQTLMTLADHS